MRFVQKKRNVLMCVVVGRAVRYMKKCYCCFRFGGGETALTEGDRGDSLRSRPSWRPLVDPKPREELEDFCRRLEPCDLLREALEPLPFFAFRGVDVEALT